MMIGRFLIIKNCTVIFFRVFDNEFQNYVFIFYNRFKEKI